MCLCTAACKGVKEWTKTSGGLKSWSSRFEMGRNSSLP